MKKFLNGYWRGTEYAIQKCATSACGLFWVEGNQDPPDSGKAFTSSVTAWKDLDWGSGPERELLPEMTLYLKHRAAWQGKHLLFLLSHELPSSSLKPPSQSSAQDSIETSIAWRPFGSHIFGAPVHLISIFFLVNLSYVNLITRPAKEPRRVEGKFFFLPLQCT